MLLNNITTLNLKLTLKLMILRLKMADRIPEVILCDRHSIVENFLDLFEMFNVK